MMKTRLLAAIALAALPAGVLRAQAADTALLDAQRSAIDAFSWMDGTWRGEAVTSGADGEHRIVQTERIGSFLGGTIKVIEGKGFNPDGSVGFNAFAVISYDAAKKIYAFRSYAQGYAGTFTIVPNAKGYVWEIPASGTTMRYTATLEGGKWREVGERIVPGQPPRRFFEMTLTRVGSTDWPGAGGMSRQ